MGHKSSMSVTSRCKLGKRLLYVKAGWSKKKGWKVNYCVDLGGEEEG